MKLEHKVGDRVRFDVDDEHHTGEIVYIRINSMKDIAYVTKIDGSSYYALLEETKIITNYAHDISRMVTELSDMP